MGHPQSAASASFEEQIYRNSLKKVKITPDNVAVFHLVRIVRLANGHNGNEGENENFVLEVRCDHKIEIDKISLISKEGILKDFELQQEKLSEFSFGKNNRVHEEFLRATAVRGFEELAGSLSEKSEPVFRIVLASAKGGGTDDFAIKGILADRRVAKLYEGLSRMDPKDAELVAKGLYVKAFKQYAEVWEQADILPTRMIYGPQAHLFLCSEFCSSEVTMEEIDRWNNWYAKSVDGKGFQFKHSAKLDELFSMNLQANMIRKKNNWSIKDLNAFFAKTLDPILSVGGNRPPTFQWSILRSSDWTPKQVDVLNFIPTFEHTSALSHPTRQGFVFDILRNELLELR